MRTAGNTVLVLVAAAALLFFLTDGLNAFTSEGARRYHVEKHPLTLPQVRLTDTSGEAFYIQDFRGQTVLVDFIFTHCADICPTLTRRFREIQKHLQAMHLQERIMLLTVSFDPVRDTAEALRDYAAAANSDTATWKFATVRDQKQLQALLDSFGIIVIAASNGQFEHNAAIHRIDPAGWLSGIYDYASTKLILRDLEASYGGL